VKLLLISFRNNFRLLVDTYRREGLITTLRKGFVHILVILHSFWHGMFWRIYAEVLNKRLVYFIGDSHVRVFDLERGMFTYAISSSTAHNLINIHSATNSRRLVFEALSKVNRKRDVVVMVFGEVDCRFHFYYQYIKNEGKVTIEELVNRTILNYGVVLREIKEKEFLICVCGVMPACILGNNVSYPYYGATDVRANITKVFNKKLQVLCVRNNIPFIDIYEPAADSNGLVNEEYLLDDIHLNKKIIPYVRVQLKAVCNNGAF
jgi:hypothetical protein